MNLRERLGLRPSPGLAPCPVRVPIDPADAEVLRWRAMQARMEHQARSGQLSLARDNDAAWAALTGEGPRR